MKSKVAEVYFKLKPTDTNYINRIVEGYEYLGVMTTIDKKEAISMICSTEDMKPVLLEVLKSLPEVIEIITYPLDNAGVTDL